MFEGKKRTPTIYSEAIKALYGTVDAAKLFYDNLCHVLINEIGFTLKPYDGCVANKIINNKQCTIVFHVDDLNISYIDKEVVSNIINELSSRFGDIMSLSVSRGKIHDYLGMTFDYTTPVRLMITMYDYIYGVIENAGGYTKKERGLQLQHLITYLKYVNPTQRITNYYPKMKKKNIIPLLLNAYICQKEEGPTYSSR